VGTARIALQIGAERQRAFLDSLGLLVPTTVELAEAPGIKPLFPQKSWPEISTMTISYGHGISASPLHLAAAYASIVNGGTKVTPTLLADTPVTVGPRVISEHTSETARSMLREVVQHGTATLAEVPGYAVGGKTGTADKPRRDGRGYEDDKVITTFAGFFPAHDPAYVIVVTLDEPEETSGTEPRRTAGWTAVPVAAEIIRRVAPLLGLRPEIEVGEVNGVTVARN
jgi:cell division protein FtsI (penicillin-binding protein 3)